MKRKMYNVEYVQRLEKLNSKAGLYREMNNTVESKIMLVFRDFLNQDDTIAEKFLGHLQGCVEGDESFKLAMAELDRLGIEMASMVGK
jgi:hypothetical protein